MVTYFTKSFKKKKNREKEKNITSAFILGLWEGKEDSTHPVRLLLTADLPGV